MYIHVICWTSYHRICWIYQRIYHYTKKKIYLYCYYYIGNTIQYNPNVMTWGPEWGFMCWATLPQPPTQETLTYKVINKYGQGLSIYLYV